MYSWESYHADYILLIVSYNPPKTGIKGDIGTHNYWGTVHLAPLAHSVRMSQRATCVPPMGAHDYYKKNSVLRVTMHFRMAVLLAAGQVSVMLMELWLEQRSM